MPSTSPPHPLDRSPTNDLPKIFTPLTAKHSSLASPTHPPNPLKSGTFGLDLFGIQAASHHTPLEYFPPFDPNANIVPPTSPLSPLNHDDNDIIRNKQKHSSNTDNDSNDYDNNNNNSNDNNDNNDANITSRSNSISFPSRKERHTFGYDDHHHGPPSFLDLPSSPMDFESIHPLDPSPYLESPPSPLHPPTYLFTMPPTQPRPLSPPPKNIKRPVVSPTFVHDQHLSEVTPTPTSSYKPSIAHRNHPNNNHNNNKHVHGAHSTPRVNNRCSMNMTDNNNLTSSPNTASDKKPNSKSAHPKRRKRFSFFANAFSNSTAPMTTNTSPHSSVSSPENHHQHHHSHPRYDALVLSSLQARPSTSLSHRISHNTLSSQTDPDFLSSAPVSSKKHISISSSSTSPRSRPCSPLTSVDMSLSPSSLVAPSSQGGLTVQVQDHWRWSNASTRAIYDRSDVRDSCGGGDASTFPEGQSAMFVSPSFPTSPSSSVYPGSMRPYAVYHGSASQESIVIETLSQQQQQQVPPGAGVTEKTEAKQGQLGSSSTVVEEGGDVTKVHGKESSPPPSSPRPSSLPQDRVAKKRRKGLSIFCFFLRR
ncbi:MAG: hypothetical protein BYD32DRAFT_437771 [Podila humilis]|nr:MAG: hypothetical protein BYD32DRAFT_437771 [Podila humilis]